MKSGKRSGMSGSEDRSSADTGGTLNRQPFLFLEWETLSFSRTGTRLLMFE